jgi:hypothetical protein
MGEDLRNEGRTSSLGFGGIRGRRFKTFLHPPSQKATAHHVARLMISQLAKALPVLVALTKNVVSGSDYGCQPTVVLQSGEDSELRNFLRRRLVHGEIFLGLLRDGCARSTTTWSRRSTRRKMSQSADEGKTRVRRDEPVVNVLKWHSTAPAVAQEDVTEENVKLERDRGIRVVLHVDPVGQLAMELPSSRCLANMITCFEALSHTLPSVGERAGGTTTSQCVGRRGWWLKEPTYA